mgnify:CR=1 FL=1
MGARSLLGLLGAVLAAARGGAGFLPGLSLLHL